MLQEANNIVIISYWISSLFFHVVGVIGYEMTRYISEEESERAEVCVAILEPADVTNIDPLSFVFFFLETIDGSATG